MQQASRTHFPAEEQTDPSLLKPDAGNKMECSSSLSGWHILLSVHDDVNDETEDPLHDVMQDRNVLQGNSHGASDQEVMEDRPPPTLLPEHRSNSFCLGGRTQIQSNYNRGGCAVGVLYTAPKKGDRAHYNRRIGKILQEEADIELLERLGEGRMHQLKFARLVASSSRRHTSTERRILRWEAQQRPW